MSDSGYMWAVSQAKNTWTKRYAIDEAVLEMYQRINELEAGIGKFIQKWDSEKVWDSDVDELRTLLNQPGEKESHES